uniref:Repetin-like n=1 Tax=Crassostrea virginica TaxID=6565 RepID=A0A8B8CII6_CRAVI|nr:repetin-like [Crassostrea virginica]
MADTQHGCEQMKAIDNVSHDEQDSCPKNLTSGNCNSCAGTQENKEFVCLSQDPKEEINMVDRPDEAQKISSEIPTSENGHQKTPIDSISMKITDESKDESKSGSENLELTNFGGDKEKAEETAIDQATENLQRNGLDIGTDKDGQQVSEEGSTEKNVSDTITPASNSNLDKSDINEQQSAGGGYQGNSTEDMDKSNGGNERDSHNREIDKNVIPENVGEPKEVHDVCQSNSVTDNQKQCSGNDGGGHSKKGKKHKKTKWKKFDPNQAVKSSDLKEPHQAGSYDQRNSMEDKKYHDGGHLNPQDRRGHRNYKPENRGEQRKENTGKHSHTPRDQRLNSGKTDEWPSPMGKKSTQNYDWGNQRNDQSRENDRDGGKPKHGRDWKEVHASKHRQNPDHQRQQGHYESSFATERSSANEMSSANERSTAQARNSTEDEENSTMDNQSGVHCRESDRDSMPTNEGGWTVHASKHKSKPGVQRQYGGNGEGMPSHRDNKKGWNEHENQSGIHNRESDRESKSTHDGEWKEVHASKHKSKPGIQRQYGGNGDERPPRRDRKNRWKENEKDHAYQGEKNSEKENKEWSRRERNKNSGGEKKHHTYPDESHKYEYFWRNHSVYSQWYLSDFEVDGIKFNCTEKYMMYHKAVLMEDHEIADYILTLDDPREMKQQGRYVRNFDQKLWDENCQAIVETGNIAKFSQNEKLKETLLSTYPKTLVEASPMDRIWGIGLAEDDPRAWNKKSWNGKNLLGEVLTRVRNKLMGSNPGSANPPEAEKRAVKDNE